jgi:hypothetical protein
MGIEQSGAIRVQTATGSFAWALIPTHAHLLLCTGGASIVMVMRRLPIGTAAAVTGFGTVTTPSCARKTPARQIQAAGHRTRPALFLGGE